jgi:competence protein ComEA
MKNPTADLADARDGAPSKDKRMLVLFLFGLLLLVVDLVPKQESKEAVGYGVRKQENWQVVILGPTVHQRGSSNEVALDPAEPIAPELPARLALFVHQPLAINRADRKSLELLPGVGPHLARAIVASIAEYGPMSGPEDLQKVAGVGPKTLERLLPLIHFR